MTCSVCSDRFAFYNLLSGGGAAVNTGGAIVLTVAFVLIALAAAYFLYRGVRKERNRYIAERLKADDMNKKSFDEMLVRRFKVAKTDSQFAVMLIKILGGGELFKSLGERQYLAVLKEVQNRIYSVVPKNSKTCVYDEDLLAVFIDDDIDDKAAASLAESCIAEARKTITLITKVQVSLEVNVGFAKYGGAQNLTVEKFWANLKHALMSAEKSGANVFYIHALSADFEDDETAGFYKDIENAVKENEFTLHYQPIKKLDGKIVAYESLLRWNHKEYGLIKANRFLPALIHTGDIDRVGFDMFAKLCAFSAEYISRREEKDDVLFSMNVSTRQMLLKNFPDELYRIAKKYRQSPSAFCIEISDFKNAAVLENIRKLKEYGFKVAVDGFNMAGSSETLNELQTFSPEWIKLPVAFISECKDNFFARGMVDMFIRYSASDGVKIIATGVENKEQADYIKSLKIGYAQGAFIAEETPALS